MTLTPAVAVDQNPDSNCDCSPLVVRQLGRTSAYYLKSNAIAQANNSVQDITIADSLAVEYQAIISGFPRILEST